MVKLFTPNITVVSSLNVYNPIVFTYGLFLVVFYFTSFRQKEVVVEFRFNYLFNYS